MQIRFSCPEERCPALIEFEPLADAGADIECPRCNTRHPLTLDDTIRRENRLDRCPRCGGTELFVRKDFPQALGLLIVVVAAGVSCYYLTELGFYTIGILTAAALFDLALYLLVGQVAVCYRCYAEYRKLQADPDHKPFDLATSEKYA